MLDLEIPDGQYSLKGVSFNYDHIDDKDGNTMAFRLGDTIYIVYEDENDGYRSTAYDKATIRPAEANELNEFDIWVEVKRSDKNDEDLLNMYSLATGKLILSVGTDNICDYYPVCIMHWNPANA